MTDESIGPGAESVGVELFAPTTVDSRWDRATWDGQTWDAASWEPVECEVLSADYQSGASQEAGVLSIPDAGALDLRTYDPERLLDPLATESPFFGSVRPGTQVRLVGKVPGVVAAWSGFVDEARHELGSGTGRIRAVDGIAYLAQAELADGAVLPNTLRARVRAVVAAVGLGGAVPVQPEAASGNTIPGGGAEGYPEGYNSMPAGWRLTGGAGTLGTSAGGGPWGSPHGGTRMFNVRVTTSPAGFYGDGAALLAVQRVVPGGTYVLDGWRREELNVAPTSVAVWLLMYRADGSSIGNTGGGASRLDWAVGLDPDIWTYRTAPFVAPVDCATVALVFQVTGASGSDWLDDIALTGPLPDTTLPDDPPVAAHDGKARAAWSVIQDAALDALTYVWLGPTGTLRFTPWGSLPDAAYSVGCDDGLGGVWLEGLASLEAIAQADSIRNSVRSWVSANTFGTPAKDAGSVNKYGERRFDAARIVPNAATWAARILADRADAGLEVTLGELRPYTADELALLLNGALAGPAVLRVRDDDHGELVDLSVALLGAVVGVTAGGWRFRNVAMIPRAEWDLEEPPPVEPPIPPPNPYHSETRTYIATSDALLALTSGGAKYGAGASSTLPVGAWQGWTYRALVQLPAIPWTNVRRIVSATLILTTTTQVRVGFGSSPTIELARITGAWSAGSSSSPSSGNAVVWPGPAVTGSVRANVTGAQNATARIRCDALVLPWAPTSVGGTLAAQRGLALYPGSGSGADTSEFWPVERGGSSRPSLELVVEVFD